MSRYRLDPAEVASGWEPVDTGNSPGETPPRRVWLQHQPTGMRVTADLVTVPGDPDQPPVREAEIRKSLFAELELKVARHLGFTIKPS